MNVEPHLLVIFGASGDLMRRKLAPALLRLAEQGLLPERFAILGFARTELSDETFRSALQDALRVQPEDEAWRWLQERLFYCQGNYGDAASMARLRGCVERLNERWQLEGNRLFYLATPPRCL